MDRIATLLAVFVLLVAGAAVPVGGTVVDTAGADHASQAETATPGANGSAEAAAPGAQFAGVVDVQEAEVESELEERSFGIRVDRANSDESKAAVVAEDVEELTRRTDELRERKRNLDEARENGNISEARYRAEMAAIAARSASVERQLDRSEAVSRDLPAEALESEGVNATAIETIRNESREVAGPEAAEIARSIAGPRSGDGLDDGDDRQGPPSAIPGRSETANETDDTSILPGTDDFSTPTIPGPPEVPPGRNGSGPPTNGDNPGDRTTGDGDTGDEGLGDVLSPILGGPDGGDGNGPGNSTGSDESAGDDTTSDGRTETDGNESSGTTSG